MVKVRTAKSKGSAMEYDVQYSLEQKGWKVTRTSERGFQRQFDLEVESPQIAIECKRLKSISWNQLVKFYEKLCKVTPNHLWKHLVFKSNQQPALVFYNVSLDTTPRYEINTFEDFYSVPFLKHPSTRVKINNIKE
jgi:Holliday junction resolvase